MSLLPSERAQYSAVIDAILANADLQTIGAKKIMKRLQATLDKDLSSQKDALQELIMERFDAASAELPPSSVPKPHTNGDSSPIKAEPKVKSEAPQSDADSELDDTAPPKKKRKQSKPADDDAKLAAMLQAQENSRARPTRGGNDKKRVVKAKKPKKKSADKIKKDDDSDIELDSQGEAKEKPKKGGFHKQYHLSAPLAELVGEPTLSRPQVVKKIWEYIKARDLQDPTDKRQIRCDDRLQSVFKVDRVHMFTMNKILSKQLYDVEEQ